MTLFTNLSFTRATDSTNPKRDQISFSRLFGRGDTTE